MRAEATAALEALGFTALEAEVYASLVARSPATAYRVAQGLGKAAANVYKAVESLERKGAVLVDEGAGRLCRAVPPGELLARLGREFEATRSRAAGALAGLGAPAGHDERVYALRTPEQVYARCRHLLASARRQVLLDLFPAPLAELAADLEAAARRGVCVVAQAYRPAPAPRGVELVVAPDGARQLAHWPGAWLNAVADGAGLLLALLRPDGVHQAVWSDSAYLSLLYQSGLASEIRLTRLERALAEGASREALGAELERSRRQLSVLASEGAAQLKRRFMLGAEARGGDDEAETAGGAAPAAGGGAAGRAVGGGAKGGRRARGAKRGAA